MTNDVLVLGSGVTGLTTAILLAEAGCPVQLKTSETADATTSVVAGALLGPIIPEPDPRVARWLTHGDTVFRELATDPSTGVRVAPGRLISKAVGLPPWATSVPGFAECVGHDKPAGFATAFRVEVPIADMRCYLTYLTNRFIAAGGAITIDPVRTLDEAAAQAPLVLNCTGVYASRLTPDNDLHPVRGQHVIVRNPGQDEFLYEGGSTGSTWAGYFPHGDRVVLGGIAVADVWDRTPDDEVTAGILARTTAIEPRLAGAEVLGVEVGLRPVRSTLRIEAERIGRATVVHHYGHGGNGVQWSWGSAREAVALALGMTTQRS